MDNQEIVTHLLHRNVRSDSNFYNSCSIAIFLNKSLVRIATSPTKTFFLYFGIQTK